MRDKESDAVSFQDAQEFLDLARSRLADLMDFMDEKPAWRLKRALMVSSMIERIGKIARKCELLARDCRDGSVYK